MLSAEVNAGPVAACRVPVKPERKKIEDDPQVRQYKKAGAEDKAEMSTSPRIRRRLSNAKESASIFNIVCEQGEVIQWMTACHPDLTAFGQDLERRGYRTLSSIAFLTDEDVEGVVDLELRQLLMTTLARLRHEFFRM